MIFGRGQSPVDLPGIAVASPLAVLSFELRACRVVGAHAIPAQAMLGEGLCEQPGAHMDADARVVQIPFGDAVPRQRWQVRAVDLHQADVVAARALAVAEVERFGI